ncbi:MAG: trypsin-like peptidase domain-containing protein [Deltaproteobacteria bacterium]|nr:trypsin-like peptidase domain-containing protein [Deltaproteobacteria bacterium]
MISRITFLAMSLLLALPAMADEFVSAPMRVAPAKAVATPASDYVPLAADRRPALHEHRIADAALARGFDQLSEGVWARGGKRTPAGVHADAPTLNAGDWTRIARADGLVSWMARISSPGADYLRTHFTRTVRRGEIWVIGGDGVARMARPTRTATTTDFWGPIVPGDRMTIEVVTPGDAPPANLIDTISHILPLQDLAAEQNCYSDPTCFTDGNAVKKGVGWIWLADPWGTFICTGSLLSDVSGSLAPYFLTANHCMNTQQEADAIVVVWNYHTSTCDGSVPNPVTLPNSAGSEMLAHSSQSDFALFLLDEDPPAGTTYLGWTTDALASGEDITVVHHPDGSWKRITFGDQVGGDTNFWEVRYTDGSTEGGSSGSPLFNDDMLVVGQLYGGSAWCTNMNGTDDFGKFSRSWTLGIEDYLNSSTTTTTPSTTTTTTTSTTAPTTTTTTAPTTTTTSPTTTTTIPGDDDTDDDADDDSDDDADDDGWYPDDDVSDDDTTDDDVGDDDATDDDSMDDDASGDDDDEAGGCGC